MNEYLFELGSHFKSIRKLLNWTQEDVANRINVSRNTIVNIEKNPANMKKTLAYSFYMEIYKEVYTREEALKKLNKEKLSIENDNLKDYLTKIGLTSSVLSMPALVPTVILVLGSMSKTSSFLNLFSKTKINKEELEDIGSEDIAKLMNKSLKTIKDEISDQLKMEDILEPIEFIENIDTSSSKKGN